ncbi:MAG: shikimate kinase [Candidatus Odinarchaeota archaeon]
MLKDSIALIGFMATGKTTIGKALVEYLDNDYKFIETDQLIVQQAGKSIPRIFDEEGEEEFRAYEISVCKQVSELNKVVISCGGGVILNHINIQHLSKNCYIVLLTATSDEIFNRAIKDGKETRPLIDKEDPKKEIMKILKFRKPLYEKAAEIVIDTTDKTIENIVREIVINTYLKT